MTLYIQNNPAKENNKRQRKQILALATILLFWCNTAHEEIQKNTKEEITIEEIKNTNYITSTREYKIYKLQLNSIINIKSDLQKANQKIQETPELKKILNQNDISIEILLPQIIKESNMDNKSISESWAQWYMQIMPIAIDEIYRIYKDIPWLKLDKNDPIDNIIYGLLYRKCLQSEFNTYINKNNIPANDQQKEHLINLAYNIWPSRLKKFIDNIQTAEKEQVQKELTRYIGLDYKPKKTYDKVYNITYTDVFWGEAIKTQSPREKKKVYEGIRYANIIDAIATYINKPETIQLTWTITLKENETLYQKVKELRDQNIFKSNAPIQEICEIILESNWFNENETPTNTNLLLFQDYLKDFLNN